ncbi:MAG: 30S ribosomal protein S4 [Nanoarchaeota archaeon]|nr:30S ribosomal protein S4 [Nanoarchaeota archaeon]
MGAPIKHRKKFVSHKQRWNKQSIEEEAVLVNDYALKNKKEIRKVELLISKYKRIAKELNRSNETKDGENAKHLIESLKAKGFLAAEASTLDEILDISLRDILERRLSNIIYKNKLARTPKQARQFVVHRHVKIDGKVIDSPSYPITLLQETQIEFRPSSSLSDENHPERKLASGGLVEEIEEMKKLEPVEDKSNFDEKEKILDDQEAPEVTE